MYKKVIWGWEPPQYEFLNNGKIRIFFYTEQFTETVKHEDPETGEITEDEITRWACDIIEIEDAELKTKIINDINGIETQRYIAKLKINAYDSSSHVNQFSIGGYPTWLDKSTRVGLKLRFDAEVAAGKTETILWQDGIPFTLPLTGDASAFVILNAIELYASASYDNTQMHLAAIKELTDADAIKNYDITAGYPEKLAF